MLRYDFTAEEIYSLSKDLAVKNVAMRSEEEEKKAIVSQYSSRINTLRSQIQDLSNKVSSGYEVRKVQCNIKYHFPEQNKKQITRTDTKEKFVEPMTKEDHHLWNQVDESDRKALEDDRIGKEKSSGKKAQPEDLPGQNTTSNR